MLRELLKLIIYKGGYKPQQSSSHYILKITMKGFIIFVQTFSEKILGKLLSFFNPTRQGKG